MTGQKFGFSGGVVTVGLALCLGAGRAQGELQRTVLLNYDFETVDAENIFTVTNYGGTVSTTNMTDLGAVNKFLTSDAGNRWGMAEASNRVVRLRDTFDTPWATYKSEEKASKGSAVVAALNALVPGVYYLRVSYDQHLITQNIKFGVQIYGSNGGVSQGRGVKGTPGYYHAVRADLIGVNVLDVANDGAFTKCGTEHELNSEAAAGLYPWRIKVVPATATPDDVNVFKQGTFTQLDINVWQTKLGTNEQYPDCYFDNIKVEAFKVDPKEPLYLDEIMRTKEIGPAQAFTTAYVNFTGTGTLYPGDGMVELVGFVTTNNAATTNYTRSGASVSFAPYVNSTTTQYAGSFGFGLLGYKALLNSGFNRYHPLWILGDGQTAPTNSIAMWKLRDQGLASHGFGCHVNQFVTFDTHKIRSYLLEGTLHPMVITGRFGMSGEMQNAAYTVRGGVWVDGVRRFISGSKKRADASDAFRVKLDPADRYITFAVLDDTAFSYGQDLGVFKDVLLTLQPSGTVINFQ